ncbi:MAG: hypothetical protein Q9205_001497 [Flavoplaca limonia]
MANTVKITEDGFKIGIGFMLAVAVSLAFGRIYVRAKLNHKFYVDDGFFSLAVITLIAGTIMTYLDIPYIYLQQNVQAGSQAPPADFIQQLLTSVKIQNAAVVLLSTTVFAIKLAFLAFFRGLIRRLKKLEIWWWCVLVIVILSSIFLICANFITCPYYDKRILVKCVSPSALQRQNATLRAVSILDILSDLFSPILVISIPIALLWRVRVDLRRKLALGTMLCLSVFTIITVIVKISGGNTIAGQIDSSWVIFWLHMEAAVAVMVASIMVYRALFVIERSRTEESPRHTSGARARIWDRSKYSQEIHQPAHRAEAPVSRDPSDGRRASFRHGNGYRSRSASVTKHTSPSDEDGAVGKGVRLDFRDDTLLTIRSPKSAYGYPSTGPPVNLDLRSKEQDEKCRKQRCSSSTAGSPEVMYKDSDVSRIRSKSLERGRDLNEVSFMEASRRETKV